MALIRSIQQALAALQEKQSVSVALYELNPQNDAPDPKKAYRFQYFPETISDSYRPNYVNQDLLGASLPIPQWTSGSARTINFTAVFSNDFDIDSDGALAIKEDPTLLDRFPELRERNIDVRIALLWMRKFCLPRYVNSGSVSQQMVVAPPKMLLVIPNSGIGLVNPANGFALRDSVYCKMMSCEIEYTRFHPNGSPKIALCQLSFQQTPLVNGTISFPQMTNELDSLVYENGNGKFYSFGYGLKPKGNTLPAGFTELK